MDKLQAALDVLRAHGIEPEQEDADFPEIGNINDDETVYATSLESVFGDDDTGDDERLVGRPRRSPGREWEERLRQVIQDAQRQDDLFSNKRQPVQPPEPPEPHCAWYCPIHYFGYGWGIYIREECILQEALSIAHFVNWRDAATLRLSFAEQTRRLLRAAFYGLFLHEQFHHKVESLGFRLLLASGARKYPMYKANVYRPTFRTHNCLEESLANADSYHRVDEPRYKDRLGAPFRRGFRRYLRWAFPKQPPGYSDAAKFLTRVKFADGTRQLQSRVLDGMIQPHTPTSHWLASPDVIRSMMDITEEIYVILALGSTPLFSPTTVDPGYTVSTDEFAKALVRFHGYEVDKGGGKGSHLKLSKPGSPPIVLKGNQRILTPGLVRHVLRQLGGFPLSRLPDVLEGRVP